MTIGRKETEMTESGAGRGLWCYIIALGLCLDLATASHLLSELSEDGEEPQHPPEKLSQGSEEGKNLADEVNRRRDSSIMVPSSTEEQEEDRVGLPSMMSDSHDRLQCPVESSCSARVGQDSYKTSAMLPCKCDDQCYLYGDCCHDHPYASLPPPASRPICRPLIPTAGRHYTAYRTVFLVNWCPLETEQQLADRCLGVRVPSYLMDIPVFSRTSNFGYANIFCAICHKDIDIYKFNMSISCLGSVNSTTELENMTYHAGELRWSSQGSTEDDAEVSCLLDVAFPPSLGRWCQSQLVNACSRDWPHEVDARRCTAYNDYVQAGVSVYKNRDCAVCNGVPQDQIKCLSLFRFYGTSWSPSTYSMMELFEVKGDCAHDEVWDALYRRCEHISCGFFFTLVNGKCEKSNRTTVRSDKSYLNASCYIMVYPQELFTTFSNQSIYLKQTQRLYTFGEYEFNGTWVRVCDEKERWTPFMYLLSSVLIVVSLVCLVLHMAIFLLLPERRNIPSMNLFSMTVSLFLAEFMFLTLFRLKQQISYVTCVISGVLIYYFLSVSFLWTNVMSIDIFRTFYSVTYRTKSRAVFIQYSLYAWLLPIGGVVLAVVVDQVWPHLTIAPHFGTDNCWLNNKWGLVAFFTLPSGLVILANLVLYMVSVRNIYTQIKFGKMASSTICKNDASSKHGGLSSQNKTSAESSNSGKKVSTGPNEKSSGGADSPGRKIIRKKLNRSFQRKHCGRLILYCKLALIMGMTWIFAFISIHSRSLIFEYLFIVFNGLQGTFIFIAFDLKRKVWEDLWSRSICGGRQCRENSNMYTPKSWSPRTTTKEYRWSSRQDVEGWRAASVSTSVCNIHPSQDTAQSEV